MTDEIHERMSPLCQKISSGGKTLQIDIFKDGEGGWTLEVIDEFNNSTIWDDSFETDSAALNVAKQAISAEGVGSLIGPASGRGEWC